MKQNDLNGIQKIGVAIFFLAGPILALISWQHGPIFDWPMPIHYLIAAVGGAIGMAMYAPRGVRMVGAVCGLLMGLGPSDSIYIIRLFVPPSIIMKVCW